jgi:phosphoserine aminotransferase
MQGGAIGENAIVPMNLIGSKGKADYIVTGEWSKRSQKEATRFGQVNVAANSEAGHYTHIPKQQDWKLDPGASYVHICSNETIGGVQFHWTPDTGGVPLVADMSSDILSRAIDVSKYGLIYAGAQKNMGPSGLTVVIVREDLMGHALPVTPSAFNYQLQSENDSMYNTPPCYPIYIAKLVYEWILSLGGLEEMKKLNVAKANLLYDYLDSQDYYLAPVKKDSRSMMNVTFVTGDADLDKKFASEAAKAGLKNLKGHRSVGGMRASIYNAMPYTGVEALIAFMKKFAAENPKA